MGIERFVSRRGFRPLLIPILLFLLLAGVLVTSRADIERRVAPPADTGASVPAAVTLTPEEQAFYDYVGPRLSHLAAEADALAGLGQERSRNLIELQVRSDRVSRISDEIASYVTNVPIPARFAGAMAEYDSGVAALRTGMEDARTAFFGFDWEALGAALDRFTVGADRIARADRMLDAAVGIALPAASPVNG
jgi:hypothetical protein